MNERNICQGIEGVYITFWDLAIQPPDGSPDEKTCNRSATNPPPTQRTSVRNSGAKRQNDTSGSYGRRIMVGVGETEPPIVRAGLRFMERQPTVWTPGTKVSRSAPSERKRCVVSKFLSESCTSPISRASERVIRKQPEYKIAPRRSNLTAPLQTSIIYYVSGD
jgi:hypothetical protein